MSTTTRRGNSRRLGAAAALAGVAAVAGGCGAGGGGGAITVGAPAPSAAQLARATALTAPASADAVGPGAVRARVQRGGYGVTVRIVPNRASVANRFSVSLTRAGAPVAGARVTLDAAMTTMDMGIAHYDLAGAGTYTARAPAWVMRGRWRIAVSVAPPGHAPLRVVLDDTMGR